MATSKTKSTGQDALPRGYVLLTVIDRSFTLLTDMVWAGCIVGVAYTIYLCVRELSGHDTMAQFIVGYFSDGKGGASAKPWIGATCLSSLWGLVERWLRRRKVGSMSQRIKDLETFLDSKRSSSGLTSTGQVPKKGRAKDE